jgi:hypothetical protein
MMGAINAQGARKSYGAMGPSPFVQMLKKWAMTITKIRDERP